MPAVAQRSFAGGEIAPALYARTDQVRYATGLRTCRNMIVQRHGGAANRPGLVYIAAAKDSAVACRLIPFVLDATDVADTYLLEFGAGYIRFYQDGGRVVVSSVTAWATATAYVAGDVRSDAGVNYYCVLAHTSGAASKPGSGASWQTNWYALEGTIYEIPTPYATADLPDLNFVQSGDVITLVHPTYPPQKLQRYAHTRWLRTPVSFGPEIAAPTNLQVTGTGAAGFQRHYAVTAVKEITLEESLAATATFAKVVDATTPAELIWNPVPGAISYNVYRSNDGVTFGLVSSAGGLPTETADTSWTDTTETATSSDPTVWTPAAGQLLNTLGVSATDRAYNGSYRVAFTYTVSATTGSDGVIEARYNVYYKRNTDAARVLAYTSPSILFDPGGYVGVPALGPVDVNVTIDVPDDGYTTLRIEIVPEVVGPRTTGTASFNVDATSGTVSWDGQNTGFNDVGLTPDYSLAPAAHPTIFAAAGDFPSAVTYFQQRLFYGGTTNAPENIRGSRIGSFSSYSISTPLQPDDAIAFTIVGRRVNGVRHMLDMGKLVVFGTGSVQGINGDDAGTLRPDAINPFKIAANGCGRLAPVEVDDAAVYVQGRGGRVRNLKQIPNSDGYAGTDLTLFATHLFAGKTIVDIAYQEDPHSVVWCVRSDGVLLGLTYIPDQEIWGWHRHDTLGTVENVCVIPEGDEDAVYVVVAREIDGETVRYIERMASRVIEDVVDAIFMDAALSYDGWHTGVTTMRLSGGTDYTSLEQLTLTASAAAFASSADIGKAVFLEDEDGNMVRLTIEAFTSTTIVSVRADRTVSVALQAAIGNGNGRWALAVASVSGLSHLEGEEVSILADGYVVSSPNNIIDHPTVRSVSGGAVTLDRPYAVIHVGLPYLADLETLDLDSPGPRTVKDKKQLVNQVIAFTEASRGLWAGRGDKVTDDLPLAGLQATRDRSAERAAETYDTPPALITDAVTVNIDNNWNNNGRVLYRQPDPLPMTILSATAVGFLP